MQGANPEALLKPYGVSRESLDRLQAYVALLESWQRRINLIGPSTTGAIWTRHILDAVQLLPLIPPGTKAIADLGAGAGIPGLILAIAGGYEAHLYESNGKKAAFLGEAIRKTAYTAVVHPVRIETLANGRDLPDVQVVVARALAPLDQLLGHAAAFLDRGAIGLFHKGQDIDAELTKATKSWKINYTKHPSVTDSGGVILEVKEAIRVAG